jgi:hypothetical protein
MKDCIKYDESKDTYVWNTDICYRDEYSTICVPNHKCENNTHLFEEVKSCLNVAPPSPEEKCLAQHDYTLKPWQASMRRCSNKWECCKAESYWSDDYNDWTYEMCWQNRDILRDMHTCLKYPPYVAPPPRPPSPYATPPSPELDREDNYQRCFPQAKHWWEEQPMQPLRDDPLCRRRYKIAGYHDETAHCTDVWDKCKRGGSAKKDSNEYDEYCSHNHDFLYSMQECSDCLDGIGVDTCVAEFLDTTYTVIETCTQDPGACAKDIFEKAEQFTDILADSTQLKEIKYDCGKRYCGAV